MFIVFVLMNIYTQHFFLQLPDLSLWWSCDVWPHDQFLHPHISVRQHDKTLDRKRLRGGAPLWLAVRAVYHCSCVMRENTPGGSFPSPSAAHRPSCCRARTSSTSPWNVRGSVTARSLSIRRFNCTLHCGRSLHTNHQVFNTQLPCT